MKNLDIHSQRMLVVIVWMGSPCTLKQIVSSAFVNWLNRVTVYFLEKRISSVTVITLLVFGVILVINSHV